MAVHSAQHQAFKKNMQKYHRMVPCDACHIFQVFGVYSMIRFGENKLKFNILFNEYPDLDRWSLCMTACHETLLAQSSLRLAQKKHTSYEKSRLIKMRHEKTTARNPQNSICILSWLSWISLDRNSGCHGSQSDGWQINAITCCNEHNRYICLREESTWIVFHVVFLLILIFHNFCAFSWVSWSKLLSHEYTVVHRDQWPRSWFLLNNVKFQFVFTKTYRIPTEHMEYTAH